MEPFDAAGRRVGKEKSRRPGSPAALPVLVEPPAAADPAAWDEFYRVVVDEARIRLELPRLLADLVDAGKPLRAAELVRQWGRGERSPRSIWRQAREEVRPS